MQINSSASEVIYTLPCLRRVFQLAIYAMFVSAKVMSNHIRDKH